MFLKVSNAKTDSTVQTVSQDNQEKQAHYGLLQRYWLTDLKIYKISAKAKLWRPIGGPVVGATEDAMPKQASVSFLRHSDNQLEQSHSVCGRSNWLEHSQTSITPAAESKCAVYSDLLHISIYSIFLLIEVCRGCTLKLTV